MEVKKDNSNAADSIQSYRPARSALLPASNAGLTPYLTPFYIFRNFSKVIQDVGVIKTKKGNCVSFFLSSFSTYSNVSPMNSRLPYMLLVDDNVENKSNDDEHHTSPCVPVVVNHVL